MQWSVRSIGMTMLMKQVKVISKLLMIRHGPDWPNLKASTCGMPMFGKTLL
ncbi:hypothetical protein D3C71_1294550 [compost metagenome]